MAKLFNYGYSNRILFPNGQQKQFLESIEQIIGRKRTVQLCKICDRTWRDWKKEKFTMAEVVVSKLSKIANVPLPNNTKILPAYWSAKKYAKLGAQKATEKHGPIHQRNPEKRLANWRQWWHEKGKYLEKSITQPRAITKPRKNIYLAELFGIIMGDGGITEYQLTVTLSRLELDYIDFVSKLIQKLFSIKPGLSLETSVINIVVSRKNLTKFLLQNGLVQGNKIKQQIDIPNWIKQNNRYSLACLRGLVDTDGCVFTHRYKVNNKWYSYKKLDFTSRSKPLIRSVKKIFINNGFTPKLSYRGDIRLYSQLEVNRYFKEIGSHNQKHIERFNK